MFEPRLMGDVLKYSLKVTNTDPLAALTGDPKLALFTVMPSVGTDGSFTGWTEVSGANYSRQKLNAIGHEGNNLLFDAGRISQTISFDGGPAEQRTVTEVFNKLEDIHFPYTGETGNGYGTVVGYGVFVGNRLICCEEFATAKVIGANTTPLVKKEELVFTM